MMNRMAAAFGAILLCLSPALGQTPEYLTEGPTPLPVLSDGVVEPSPSRGRQIWASADYLLAFVRGTNLPISATTSPAGTPRALAGVIGAGGTDTLFGGWVNDQPRAGIRFGAGWWFGTEQPLGIEAGFTLLESRAAIFSASSDNFPILALPYINASSNTQQAVLVAFPGSSTGSLDIRAASSNFWEAHVDLTEKALDEGWFRLNSLFGYRFYRFDETLGINQTVAPTNPNFVQGTQILTNDNFHTRNEFHGVDLGFRTQFFWEKWSLDLLGKIAIGKVFREVNINGDQTVTVPGLAPILRSGGTYALSSNSGLFQSNDWKVMPEFGAGLGWRVRPNVNLRFGYTFLLLNGVARAADQVDVHINPNLLPPANLGSAPARPAFGLNRTDVWIQSLNFGVEVIY